MIKNNNAKSLTLVLLKTQLRLLVRYYTLLLNLLRDNLSNLLICFIIYGCFLVGDFVR